MSRSDDRPGPEAPWRALPRAYRDWVNNGRAKLRRTTLLSRRKNSSIVRRIQWLMIGWGVVVYLLALTGFLLASNWVIQTNFQRQATLWVDKLERLSGPLYTAYDLRQFDRMLREIAGIEEIVYLQFYQPDGKTVLASYIRPESRMRDDKPLSLAAINTADGRDYRAIDSLTFIEFRHFTRVVAPVIAERVIDEQGKTAEPRILGYLDMGIDVSQYTAAIYRYAIGGSIVISVMFLLAAVVGRWWIKRALRSLMSLREPLARLAEGDTSVRVGRYQDEEIDAISRALNTTITAIRERDEELREMANCDDLTGLVNKRAFHQMLNLECERVRLERDSSCLIFIDLDQFKYINDSLGHAAGDRLLVQVAKMLQDRMRRGDVVSRLGGDEFAVLVKSVHRDDAVEIVRSLLSAVHDFAFVDSGKTFSVYCSIGLAMIEGERYSAEEIFSQADMACYTAKSRGRNQFYVYEEEAGHREKMDFGWSQRINEAISREAFVIHFQPIFNVQAEAVSMYEVLVRMRTDEQGIIAPNLFLPVAERFGLISEIDYCVLRQTMRLLADENARGNRLLLSVNLAGQTMISPDFVDTVVGYLDRFSVTSDQLVFEIAEQAAVTSLPLVKKRMAELRAHGFHFVIDKFGGGFGSIAYLKELGVDFVKIEGQLIERINDSEVDYTVVKSMIDIAKACDKIVIAEFVANKAVIAALKTLGADYIQGNYLGAPSRELLTPAAKWGSGPVTPVGAEHKVG